jgi:Tfp pilus assembly pilus retraction ATPase PilT
MRQVRTPYSGFRKAFCVAWGLMRLVGRKRGVVVITGVTGVGGSICLMIALTRVSMFESLILLYLLIAFT